MNSETASMALMGSPFGIWLLVVAALLAAGSLIGYFRTKANGFGPFNTSVLIIILVLSFAFLALIAGLIQGQAFSQLLMAIAGFAGGLVVGKDSQNKS